MQRVCNLGALRALRDLSGKIAPMLHAASFAFLDSVNALLIGVVTALGVMLERGKYRRIVPLLIFGDWFGVFALSVVTMFVLDQLKAYVEGFLDTPILGVLLIVLGLAAAVMTWRHRGGESNEMVSKLLRPLQTPSPLTFLTGFILGVAQSITSGAFFAGLIYLAAGDYSVGIRYGGLFLYATFALSLPIAVAVFVGLVRRKPNSAAGRLFAQARENKETVSKVGSYVVAAILVIIGFAMF